MANLMRYNSTPIDAGYRGFIIEDHSILNRQPPPIVFTIRGWMVGDNIFGGIPLEGYREPFIEIYSTKDNTLKIYSYNLDLPPIEPYVDTFSIKKGRNTIDLSMFKGSIVSFKLFEEDQGLLARIKLM